MKKILLILLLGGAVLFISPYWMLYQLSGAVERSDNPEISRHVDFASFKVSVQSQLKNQLHQRLELPGQESGGPWNPIGSVLGNLVADPVLGRLADYYATPDGVASLLAGESIQQGQGNGYRGTGTQSNPGKPVHQPTLFDRGRIRYITFELSELRVPDPAANAERTFTLRRENLIFWRLTGVTMP
jgi:hypothetical protein